MKKVLSLFLTLSVLFSMINVPVFADRDAEISEKISCISIEKEVSSTIAEVGDTLTYTLNITNVGETKLTAIKIVDTFDGNTEKITINSLPEGVTYVGSGVFEIRELGVYKNITISYSYSTDEGDVGTLTNTVSVEAIPEGGGEQDKVTDDASSPTVSVAEKPDPKVSAISIEKSVDKEAIEVGDTLVFTLDIKNIGETKLTGVQVMDEFSGDINRIQIDKLLSGVTYGGNGLFDIGEMERNAGITISYSYSTEESDVGTLINSAVVKAIPEGGSERDRVSDDDASPTVSIAKKPEPKVSGIHIEKSVDKSYALVGDTILFILDIKNIGETTLTEVKIMDDFSGTIDQIEIEQLPNRAFYSGNGQFEIAELAVNEGFTITYSYIANKQDVGTIFNTVFVEGIPSGGTEQDKVFDEDSSKPIVIEEEDVFEEEEKEAEKVEVEEVVRPIRPRPQLVQKGDHLSYIIGYPDGNVYPLGMITRAEVATIFFRLLTDESRAYYWTQENPFFDVNTGDWFNNAVSVMAAAGIVNGYPDGSFHPQAPVSRAEFAAIATRFTEAGRDGVSKQYFKQHFKDINRDDWYAAAVELAYELGWAQGYDGNYRPEDLMTRAEVMTMVNRIMEREVKTEDMLPDMVRWPDNQPDEWYYEAVQEATNSHTYQHTTKKVPNLTFCYETWMKRIDNPDWGVLERSWSVANRSK